MHTPHSNDFSFKSLPFRYLGEKLHASGKNREEADCRAVVVAVQEQDNPSGPCSRPPPLSLSHEEPDRSPVESFARQTPQRSPLPKEFRVQEKVSVDKQACDRPRTQRVIERNCAGAQPSVLNIFGWRDRVRRRATVSRSDAKTHHRPLHLLPPPQRPPCLMAEDGMRHPRQPSQPLFGDVRRRERSSRGGSSKVHTFLGLGHLREAKGVGNERRPLRDRIFTNFRIRFSTRRSDL